jgi:hypothetical protein
VQLPLARSGRFFVKQQLHEHAPLFGREDVALAQELVDDALLLDGLKFGNARALGFDARPIRFVGEDLADHVLAVLRDLAPARVELTHERLFDLLPPAGLLAIELEMGIAWSS